MDDRDFIREVKNLIDRFVAEWIALNSEYEKSITKELEEMENQTKTYNYDEPVEYDLRYKEKL